MSDVMGIVYTTKDDLTLRELTSQRAVAAIPVAGRYRRTPSGRAPQTIYIICIASCS